MLADLSVKERSWALEYRTRIRAGRGWTALAPESFAGTLSPRVGIPEGSQVIIIAEIESDDLGSEPVYLCEYQGHCAEFKRTMLKPLEG